MFHCVHHSLLAHLISGDGEYVIEVVYEDFIALNEDIKFHFPHLRIPNLPSQDAPNDYFKCMIHDYFAVLSTLSCHLVFRYSPNGDPCNSKMAQVCS